MNASSCSGGSSSGRAHPTAPNPARHPKLPQIYGRNDKVPLGTYYTAPPQKTVTLSAEF